MIIASLIILVSIDNSPQQWQAMEKDERIKISNPVEAVSGRHELVKKNDPFEKVY